MDFLKKLKSYYNTSPMEFVFKQNMKLNEDNEYVARFTLKTRSPISNIPINQPMKPTQELIEKAIKYGMIFLIVYKGAKDKYPIGHERVIYPMVIGRSMKGNILIRGYHLTGWSISQYKHTEKVWRMFRLDRVLYITFTGSFYRMPPADYKMNDSGMRGGIIASADFTTIRKNQQELVDKSEIQDKSDVDMTEEKGLSSVKVQKLDGVLDLTNPFDNKYIKDNRFLGAMQLTFLKSLYGLKQIVILGALGKPGTTVKVEDGTGEVGMFKIVDSTTGDILKKMKVFKGKPEYDMYLFDKKITVKV
jgi:hypothetical protein